MATNPELTPLQRAFLALEETQARLVRAESALREPIAIIGMGCRVPGADDPEAFWRLLRDGVDAVTPPPAQRFGLEGGNPALRPAGYLRSVDGFEPEFFGISKREADGMDPQQRLLLEVSWEALESAGQAADRLERSATGVYIGICGTDYATLQLGAGDPALVNPHYASGIAHSVASGRISYVLGLQGPSLSIDTACSSSLVAVHAACQALRAGDCRMALAGGVNLMLAVEPFVAFAESRMLAPDGKCKTFDAAADGFARGEGCGVVVLKRLVDARADGDRILAVIRGTAVNQDGPSSGLTAPNGPAQEAVIREALRRSGIGPGDVGYIETHGTGTQLGDPLEVQALGEVFGRDRDPEHPLLIGAVKTNVGHLEAAAGITGLIKVVLSLRQETIPPHLHFREPSPHIDWSGLPFRVPTRLMPWTPLAGRRIAGVSSFGFSGTNAHVVVEQAPAGMARPEIAQRSVELFTVSARTRAALGALADRTARQLASPPDVHFEDVCFTSTVGRAHLADRAVIIASGMTELRAGLAAVAAGESHPAVRSAYVGRRDPLRIAFLFTGQGAQYAGMACGLFDHSPVFRAALQRCAAILDPQLPSPLMDVLRGVDESARMLDQTRFTQPALFAVEYAIAELWKSWGIEPAIVLGHSVGEYVAACIAGVMGLEEALTLIAQRGRLMQSLPSGGGMVAIYADEAQVAAAVHAYSAAVAVAAINAPEQCVISGEMTLVHEIAAQFAARGVRVQQLTVSHAFHSPLVEPILDEFERLASGVRFAAPRLRVISNRNGAVVGGDEMAAPGYWRRHLREPVQFAASLRTLAGLKPDMCIEIGPHPALLGFAKMAFGDGGPLLVPTLRRERDDWRQMLEALTNVHLGGGEVRWRELFAGRSARPISLPGYPFERERCWFAARSRRSATVGRDSGNPLLGARLRWAARDCIHETRLSADSPAFVAQHRVQGRIVMPATGLLETVLAAAQAALGAATNCVEQVTLQEALLLDDDTDVARTIQVVSTPQADGSLSIRVCSAPADAVAETEWTEHVQARAGGGAGIASRAPELSAAKARCIEVVARDDFYQRLCAHGLDFGPAFHSIDAIRRGKDCAIADVSLVDELADEVGLYRMHPVLLDGCLQVVAAAANDVDALFLPFCIGRYVLHARPGANCSAFATMSAATSPETRRAEVAVFAADGTLVAELQDVRLKRVAANALDRLGRRWLDESLYQVDWVDAPAASGPREPSVPVAELAGRAVASIDELRRVAGLDQYDAFLPKLDRLCLDLVVQCMRQLGWQPETGDRIVVAELATRLHIAKHHSRLLRRLLQILAEEHLVERDGDDWIVVRTLDSVEPGPVATQLAAEYPDATAELEMTTRAGAQFAAALRDECDPLQLLFPAGSLATAEKLYRDTPPARVFNGLMAEIAAALAKNAATGRPLRILELGAGTGGTTAHVLPRLPAQGVEYTFTDIGALFVARARERFGVEHRGMSFATLDLEADPEAQGFQPGSYDLVLASNVIHATRDLRRTLAAVKRLLAPGGTLAMLEVTAPQRWFDLTVGLTEGWWCFEDLDLRQDYATLSTGRWLGLLADCGFAQSVAVPGEARRSATLDLNTMLLARVAAAPHDAMPRSWVVFADAAGVAGALVAALRARGERCFIVREGRDVALAGEEGTLDPTQPGHYRQLIEALEVAGGGIHGYVHCWSQRHVRGSDEPPDALADATLSCVVSAMHLAQAIVVRGSQARLWLVTRGAQQAGSPDAAPDPAQAAISGLCKSLVLEHPELRCVCVDVDPDAAAAEVDALLSEFAEPGSEPQVALRGGHRRVPRLVRARASSAATVMQSDGSWRLVPVSAGSFDGFQRVALHRRPPGVGEVEIEIEATGLNFKDVLNVLGMYPGNPGPLGGECAGVVAAVGAGVEHLQVGDAVMALGGGCFASHVTTRAEFVQRRPPDQGAAEGASVPIAFLTAQFCLAHLAGLRAGERVLIHAAAGGVGMAAVRLALAAGAQVFATAGSPWKRELLRTIGVEHVYDSRSSGFADAILSATGGRGVEVVLNSLAGEQIEASFRAISRGGRFVEIGKRGIKTPAWVDALGRELRYSIVDWGETAARDPALIGRMFGDLAQRLHCGELAPLPRHEFSVEQADRAFRFMAQARHAGKIVVTLRPQGPRSVQRNGTYLVTGGLSGLGPVVARWLAGHGAGRLVLVGRRGITPEVEPLLRELRTAGVTVVAEAIDVADATALRALLARLRANGPPLRGIVHSAGVLDDAALVQQDARRFARVFGPKVRGTALLDMLTRSDPLDWVAYFSSIASVLGSAGQGNHAAANAFLDAKAREARARGMAVASMNWGAWTEVGAAVDRGVTSRLAAQGISVISPANGMLAFDRILAGQAAQVVVLPVDWNRFREQLPGRQLPPLLAGLSAVAAAVGPAGKSATAAPADLRSQLATAPSARRRPLIAGFLRERALKVLGLDPSRSIDPRAPLGDLGLDSLLAVELRNAIGTAIGRTLPATLLFDHPTLDALADHLLVEVCGAEAASPAIAAALPPPNLVGAIEDLSDEEVERQLAERARRKQ